MPDTRLKNILKNLSSHDGIIGIIVMNDDGILFKTNFDDMTTIQYTSLVQQLIGVSKMGIKKINPNNDLTFLHLFTKKYQIKVILDKQYTMIVVHSSISSKPRMKCIGHNI